MKRVTFSSTLMAIALAVLVLAHAQLASATDRQTTATTIRVRAGEFFFRLSAKSAKPGRIMFVVRNTGSVVHDFKINGKKTPLIQPGKTAKLIVIFRKKGKYPYRCTVPEHAGAGMKGIFRVR